MDTWLSAIILGIIEGVTEFLPISSTGHLLIAEHLHWVKEQSDLFNVVIQSGAVLAVLTVFGKRLKHLATTLHDGRTRDYLLKLFVAFAVTAAGGLLLKKFNVKLPEKIPPVAWATLIGGLVIFVVEYLRKGKRGTDYLGWGIVVAIGLAQLLAAVFPGTSRSGASIIMALAFGIARPAATEFSFLLGVPTLLAAGALKILSAYKAHEMGHENWSMVLLATVVSAVSAFIVVKWLIRFVQGHTFNGFAVYRVLLGVALLIYAGRHP